VKTVIVVGDVSWRFSITHFWYISYFNNTCKNVRGQIWDFTVDGISAPPFKQGRSNHQHHDVRCRSPLSHPIPLPPLNGRPHHFKLFNLQTCPGRGHPPTPPIRTYPGGVGKTRGTVRCHLGRRRGSRGYIRF
jgi:hypothetical protein